MDPYYTRRYYHTTEDYEIHSARQCTDCGAYVWDESLHDNFHAQLATREDPK